MPIIKNLQSDDFLKIDRSAYRELSKNAIVVYLAFVDTYPDIDPKDAYMAKKTNLSLGTYKTGKKELKDKGYLAVIRTGTKNAIINYYFGKNAVRKYYEKRELSSNRKDKK